MNNFDELKTEESIKEWTKEKLKGGIGDTKNGPFDIYMEVGDALKRYSGKKYNLLQKVLVDLYKKVSKNPQIYTDSFIRNLHISLLDLNELPSSLRKLAKENAKENKFTNNQNKNLQLLTYFNIKLPKTFWLSIAKNYPLYAYSGFRQNYGIHKSEEVLCKIDLNNEDVVAKIYMEARAELNDGNWSESDFENYWNGLCQKFNIPDKFSI